MTAVLVPGLGLAASAFAPIAGAAGPAAISVPCGGATGGVAGFDAAITSANAGGGGTISLGHCTFAISSPDTTGADGPIALPAVTSAITIVGHGARVVESGASSQLIEVDSPGSLTVSNLVLTGGYACTGGAIGINAGAGATLTRVSVVHNTAGGQPQCGIGGDENTGAGISNAGALTVTSSNISNNSVAGYYACGGAISNSGGTLTVTGTRFSGNLAEGYGGAGGAVCDLGGTSPVTGAFSRDTFTGNTATADGQAGGREAGGGAVFGEMSYDTIAKSGFSNNAAVVGGAVSLNNATAILDDDSMDGNSASFAGGAVTDDHGSAVLADDTLSGNEAGFGTAVLSGGFDNLTSDTIVANTTTSTGSPQDDNDVIDTIYFNGSMQLAGMIIAGNDSQICDGDGVTDDGYNIADDSSCAFDLATSTNSSATIDGDLLPLGNYGGSTETAPTLEYGQIASGNSLCATPDQRGVARTSPLGCDIGAFQSDLTATKLRASQAVVRPGKAVRLTATVKGNYPASLGVHGTVRFMEGVSVLGHVTAGRNGVAVYVIAAGTLTKGTYSFSASFAGPAGYDPSTSATVTVTVS